MASRSSCPRSIKLTLLVIFRRDKIEGLFLTTGNRSHFARGIQ